MNKDRQETALYTFTIVTIIFLPLSTIASIMGMNTNDIRNMDQTQWLFWAVAIPVTIAVVFGGLYWAGELANVWEYLKNPRPQQHHSGLLQRGSKPAVVYGQEGVHLRDRYEYVDSRIQHQDRRRSYQPWEHPQWNALTYDQQRQLLNELGYQLAQ